MGEHSPASRAVDGDLLPRIAAGDVDAFTTLFRRESGAVFRFALHMTGSRSIADDVTQEVFLAVMRGAGRYVPGRSSETAWLRGITRNHVLRRLDRDHGTVALPGDDEEPAQPGGENGPLHALMRNEQVEAVRLAVSRLPVGYREVIVLCDLQELSYAAAADIIGCAIGTVRSRLSRARALLGSKLGVRSDHAAATPPAAAERRDDASERVPQGAAAVIGRPSRLSPGEVT